MQGYNNFHCFSYCGLILCTTPTCISTFYQSAMLKILKFFVYQYVINKWHTCKYLPCECHLDSIDMHFYVYASSAITCCLTSFFFLWIINPSTQIKMCMNYNTLHTSVDAGVMKILKIL